MNSKIIKIPHLDYTIVVENKDKGDRDHSDAYTKHVCYGEVLLKIKMPIGPTRASYLLHEIIHILQFICEDKGMSFTTEIESMAYLSDWLFKEIIKL